jgi:hypothetical protein
MGVLKNRSSIGFFNDGFKDNPEDFPGNLRVETAETAKSRPWGPAPRTFSTVSRM